jgi:Brp/Blh family beta-carotene 15,15'-monooxygenase
LIGGYVHGGLIVFGIIFLNKIEVNRFFEILSGDQLSLLWTSLYIGLFFWIIALTYIFFNYRKINISNYYLKLTLFILLTVLILPPLPAFAIYFCLIHSFHHIRRIIPTLLDFMEKQKAIFLMIIFSILSWVACGIAFYYLSKLNTYPDTIIKVTFIGLAALTFPHMILVDGIFRSKFKI